MRVSPNTQRPQSYLCSAVHQQSLKTRRSSDRYWRVRKETTKWNTSAFSIPINSHEFKSRMTQLGTHIGLKISQRSIHKINHYYLTQIQEPKHKKFEKLSESLWIWSYRIGKFTSHLKIKKGMTTINIVSFVHTVYFPFKHPLSCTQTGSNRANYSLTLSTNYRVPSPACTLAGSGQIEGPLMTKARADKWVIITPHANVLCNEKWENKIEDS